MTVETSDLAYSLSGLKRRDPYDQRRRFAYTLMQQGADTSPVQSPWQGVSRLAQALVGGLMLNRTESEATAREKERSDALAKAMSEPDPQKRIGLIAAYDPDAGARAASQLAVEQAKIGNQQAMLERGAAGFGGSYGMPQGPTAPPPVQGPMQAGTPAGFQNNIGNIRVSPASWEGKGAPHNGFETFATPEAGAAAMFKNLQSYIARNPNMTIADAIATWAPPSENNTQAYVARIAQAGIDPRMPLSQVLQDPQMAGRLMMTMGMHEKGGLPQGFTPQTFMTAAGGGGIPQGSTPQVAPGQPPAPSPQAVTGPAVIAPPAIPDTPRPQPSPQQIEFHRRKLLSGGYGQGQEAVRNAEAALKAEVDQQWQVDRDRARMLYEQQQSGYQYDRKRLDEAPQKGFENASKLRDDFRSEPVVKAYRTVVPMLESAKDAASRPTRAADLNLVYAFAKLMDPESVVRESETGMVTATGTVADRLQGLLGQLNGGQMLQPETRARLIAELDSRFSSLQASYSQIETSYREIAQSGGIKPEHVIIPVRPDNKLRTPPAKSGGGDVVYGLDGKPIK